MTAGPRLFSILRQGPYLIASIHTALDLEEGLSSLERLMNASPGRRT